MTDEAKKPEHLKVVPDEDNVTPIIKPVPFSADKFKSTAPPTIANVETLVTGLPHYTISQAKDFVRLHPDEKSYWSDELCFVNVPIKGASKESMHLIVEPLAKCLPSARVLHFRLVLATKPNNVFFLCHVPTRNPDNTWNETNLLACEQAKHLWTQATSRREEGVDAYKVEASRDIDAFPPPKWPKQTLDELIGATFTNRMIETANHPAFRRLIGAKQDIS